MTLLPDEESKGIHRYSAFPLNHRSNVDKYKEALKQIERYIYERDTIPTEDREVLQRLIVLALEDELYK
ncbi:hypothetical protein AAGG74_16390 [Bacillus mexicanus]|uniref:hypothetical protein n=1 Tax=Bacillus mexicanus TaxID=2834415 RepID=UPI003D1D56D3